MSFQIDMLLEDFYTVLEFKTLDVGNFEASVKIHKDHDIFKGHFPNYPVTPGVAMLQIIKNTLEAHLLQPIFMQSSSNIKFLRLVNPNEDPVLVFNINYAIEDGLIKVKNTTSFKDGSPVSKCNATFVKK